MATNRNAMAMCDQCSFVYPHRTMQLSSYNTLVCQTCFDGAYDLKNHPQNKTPDVRDNPAIRNPRPELNAERNLDWESAASIWEDTDNYWNSI